MNLRRFYPACVMGAFLWAAIVLTVVHGAAGR